MAFYKSLNQKLAESPPRSLSFASPPQSTSNMMGTQGASKLENVSERFAHLWADLHQEKQNRKVAESTKVQNLLETIAKLEKSLEVEVQRRSELDKQIQLHFDSELARIETRLGGQLTETQMSLRTSVDSLSARIQELFVVIREEREQRKNDTEHLATNLVNRVNETVQAIDGERNVRIAEQVMNSKRFNEDLQLLQQKIDSEVLIRDNALAQLRSQIHEELSTRNALDDQFRNAMIDELAALKETLRIERAERITEDDEIVQAINDYTRALQEGLKIVNS